MTSSSRKPTGPGTTAGYSTPTEAVNWSDQYGRASISATGTNYGFYNRPDLIGINVQYDHIEWSVDVVLETDGVAADPVTYTGTMFTGSSSTDQAWKRFDPDNIDWTGEALLFEGVITYVRTGYFARTDKLTYSNLTVVMVYVRKDGTLTYNANGGQGAPGQISFKWGEAFNLSSVKPTRAGYRFLGWDQSSSAIHATYQPGESVTFSESPVTLFALWRLYTGLPIRNAAGTGLLRGANGLPLVDA